jgi:hypothetical protein
MCADGVELAACKRNVLGRDVIGADGGDLALGPVDIVGQRLEFVMKPHRREGGLAPDRLEKAGDDHAHGAERNPVAVALAKLIQLDPHALLDGTAHVVTRELGHDHLRPA